jgi:hypothetical protein
MICSEDFRELLDVFCGSLGLSVEQRSDGYFRTTKFLGNGFKRKAFSRLGLEEGFGRNGETVLD